MKAFLRFVLGLVASVAAWSLAVRLDPILAPIFDPLLVLVVYLAVRQGEDGRPASPLTCALAGSAAGLLQDAFTGGRLGLYGFADTLVAWTVSKVQQRMVIQQTLQIGLVGMLASAFQLATLATLQFLMVPGGQMPTVGSAVLRITLTGVLLVGVHLAAQRVKLLTFQWREKRRSRLRFDP